MHVVFMFFFFLYLFLAITLIFRVLWERNIVRIRRIIGAEQRQQNIEGYFETQCK